MRFRVLSFFILLPFSVWAADFPDAVANQDILKLSAGGFPETKYDHSFTDRVAAMAEGYAPYESEYSDDGTCIKNCAYTGMSVDTEAKRLERDAAIIQQKISTYCAQNPKDCEPPEPAVQPESDATTVTTTTTTPTYTPAPRTCSPLNFATPANQTIPLGFPLLGKPIITSHFQPARKSPADGKVRDHAGVDFGIPFGTPIFAPARGIVQSVFQDSTCGKGVIVKHSDGFSTGYCHLSDNSFVRKGASVGAGCIIAKSGNSGRSTGPHLHYIVFLNGQKVPPEKFIR